MSNNDTLQADSAPSSTPTADLADQRPSQAHDAAPDQAVQADHPDQADQADHNVEPGDVAREPRHRLTEQRVRLNGGTVEILKRLCPAATLAGSIDLAAARLDRYEADTAARASLEAYFQTHAEAQADVSAKQANHLESIALTIDAGLAAQRAVADELTRLAAQIAGSVDLLLKPEPGGDLQAIAGIHEVMGALSGIATGIEGLGRAIGVLSDQIAEIQ